MIIVFHILLAVLSIGYATYLFFRPSKKGLRVVYTLVVLTVVSGVLLVFTKPTHIGQACISGVVYLSGIVWCVVFTRQKLASILNK